MMALPEKGFSNLSAIRLCPLCLTRHAPTAPHDRNSLYYRCIFFSQYKRWPTWHDAAAHCSPRSRTDILLVQSLLLFHWVRKEQYRVVDRLN